MPLAVGGDTATPQNLSMRLGLMKQRIAPGDFVLDVGCGRADYLRELLAHSPNIVGIETATDKLEGCFRVHPELRDRVLHVSVESMTFPAGHFDVVIVNEVLEHIQDQDAALREIHRVLRPRGKLLLFCPNRLFPFETHGLMVRGVMRMWVPALHYLPRSVCRVFKIELLARNYWPREVSKLLQQHGLQVQEQAFVQQTFEKHQRRSALACQGRASHLTARCPDVGQDTRPAGVRVCLFFFPGNSRSARVATGGSVADVDQYCGLSVSCRP
jgi:ubiquinone/menaquinone biosynthesis C-methylase UbiE